MSLFMGLSIGSCHSEPGILQRGNYIDITLAVQGCWLFCTQWQENNSLPASASVKCQSSSVKAEMLLPKLPGEPGAIEQQSSVHRICYHSMVTRGGSAWAHCTCNAPARTPSGAIQQLVLDSGIKETGEEIKEWGCPVLSLLRKLSGCHSAHLATAQHHSSCVQMSNAWQLDGK